MVRIVWFIVYTRALFITYHKPQATIVIVVCCAVALWSNYCSEFNIGYVGEALASSVPLNRRCKKPPATEPRHALQDRRQDTQQ